MPRPFTRLFSAALFSSLLVLAATAATHAAGAVTGPQASPPAPPVSAATGPQAPLCEVS